MGIEEIYFWLCINLYKLGVRHFLDIQLEMSSKQLDIKSEIQRN